MGTEKLLAGKVAVITGAGRGLGRACAEVFVRRGAKVVAIDISGAQNELGVANGGDVTPFHADVTQEDQVEAAFAAALNAYGRVDAVLNVVGSRERRPEGEVTVSEFERMLPLNLLSVILGSKHGVRAMLPTGGGSIVNFSSAGAMSSEAQAPVTYLAAKAGIHTVTKMYAVDYGPQNIRSNVIAPGLIRGDLPSGAPETAQAHTYDKPALRRPGRPADVAELAAFLASDLASYITGVVIPVDGGWTARVA